MERDYHFEPDTIIIADIVANAVAESKPDSVFYSNSLINTNADAIRLSVAITHCFGNADTVDDKNIKFDPVINAVVISEPDFIADDLADPSSDCFSVSYCLANADAEPDVFKFCFANAVHVSESFPNAITVIVSDSNGNTKSVADVNVESNTKCITDTDSNAVGNAVQHPIFDSIHFANVISNTIIFTDDDTIFDSICVVFCFAITVSLSTRHSNPNADTIVESDFIADVFIVSNIISNANSIVDDDTDPICDSHSDVHTVTISIDNPVSNA